ncbi:MAG: TetR/AcrR family transcriptional regulator, partial [Actinomycetota bacterium]|nr:TetR/AcrR family transcriptional regulator [Actinomycetota bacterium]
MRPIAPSGSPDPARRREKSREAILNATRELIIIGGWENLTIEGIAKRAGAGKQTIYRWWPTKGAVVFEAFLGDQMGGPFDLPDTGHLEDDLQMILRDTVTEFNDPAFDGIMRALLAEVQSDTALETDLKRRLLEPQRVATVRRFESAKEAGQLDPELDPE